MEIDCSSIGLEKVVLSQTVHTLTLVPVLKPVTVQAPNETSYSVTLPMHHAALYCLYLFSRSQRQPAIPRGINSGALFS